MSWLDMAHDAGYRGDEARQMAQLIEQQEREQWERDQEDRAEQELDSELEPPRLVLPDDDVPF